MNVFEIGNSLALIISGALVILFKMVALIIAYKTIKLGHDLLLKGVKGEFQFSGEANGYKADLRSASPGLLFVLLGCVIILVAISTKYSQKSEEEGLSDPQDNEHILPKVEHTDRDLGKLLDGVKNE